GPPRAAAPAVEQALRGAGIGAMWGSAGAHLHGRLRAAVRSWPRPGAIVHLALMLGRDPVELKLYGDVPRANIGDALASLGWAGHARQLAHLVDELAPPEYVGERVYLDVDLGDLGGRLGVVFAQQQLRARGTTDRGHRELLAKLHARGWCRREWAARLPNWPTTSTHPSGAQISRWL